MAILFHQNQKEIVNALNYYRFIVVNCGRRWGKTSLVLECMTAMMLLYMAARKECDILYVSVTNEQTRDLMWKPIVKRFEEEKGLQLHIDNQKMEIISPNGMQNIKLHGYENIERRRGFAYNLVVMDEVGSFQPKDAGSMGVMDVWKTIMRPTLVDRMGKAILISTPKGGNHFKDFYDTQDTDEEWKSFTFTSYDNPFLPEDEKVKMKADKSPWAKQEYEAEFLSIGDAMSIIPMQTIEGSMKRKVLNTISQIDPDMYKVLIDAVDNQPKALGVDVGEDNDYSVISYRDGLQMQIVEKINNINQMDLAGKILATHKSLPHSKDTFINIDATGIGLGVHDMLKKNQSVSHLVHKIKVGTTSKFENDYSNQRAEIMDILRQFCEVGKVNVNANVYIDFPQEDKKIINEVSRLRYEFDARQRLKIEAKEKYRQRHKSSPDTMDAMALTFARPFKEEGSFGTKIEIDDEKLDI